MIKNRRIWLYLLLIITFFLLLINGPINQSQLTIYSVTPEEFQKFLIIINLPLAIIWLAALYSQRALHIYADTLKGSPEEKGFKGLAKGCHWLVWGLPITAILTLTLAILTDGRENLVSAATIFSNYLALFLVIIAFSAMSQGTGELIKKYNVTHKRVLLDAWKQLALAGIGIGYSYLIIRNFQNNDLLSAGNHYSLPLWVLIISLVIPYLYAWFLGILTVLDITLIAKHTPGVLYRRALRALAGGLILVILSLIAVQFLKAWVPTQNVSMTFSFMAAYTIYACGIAGFMLVGEGAKRMQKMEEV